MESQKGLNSGYEQVDPNGKLPILQKHWVDQILLNDSAGCEVALLERCFLGIKHLHIPAASAERPLLGIDIGDLAHEDDTSTHCFSIRFVDPLFVWVVLRMTLPLLKVIRQTERQWKPMRRICDGHVAFYTPLSNQLGHTNLGVQCDAGDSIHKSMVLQRRRMVHHLPAAFPNEDWSCLGIWADGFDSSIFQLFCAANRHTHVIGCFRKVLFSANIVVHRTCPVHCAENGVQEIDDGLGILRRDVILALQLGFNEAATVNVACKVCFFPTPQSLRWHISREAGVLFHRPSRPRMAVGLFLCICRQPSRPLFQWILPLLVLQEAAFQVLRTLGFFNR
mmetsp:Transcript_60778/g.144792  ORF Transcript_60778/g.144792 Transcript_60778/m.144792 type:complete len:336 (-) Transcript_60778:50-1057(-)